MMIKIQSPVADREVKEDLIWRPNATDVRVVAEKVTVSAENAPVHVISKGSNGVITVNGGIVDSDPQALEDAAQDETHVGHTSSSAGV